jgi:hypothetical protein
MIRLDMLPPDHPLRSMTLDSINAHLRWTGDEWRPQGDAKPKPVHREPPCQPMPISSKCFNDLRNGWLTAYEWYCDDTPTVQETKDH